MHDALDVGLHFITLDLIIKKLLNFPCIYIYI